MENIAPNITRQRLLIEAYYENEVDEQRVKTFLTAIANQLGLRHYGEPIVHAPGGLGKDENEGFDAFLPLIDSGISLYVWTKARFLALVLFTCKEFDEQQALQFTEDYFATTKLVHKSF